MAEDDKMADDKATEKDTAKPADKELSYGEETPKDKTSEDTKSDADDKDDKPPEGEEVDDKSDKAGEGDDDDKSDDKSDDPPEIPFEIAMPEGMEVDNNLLAAAAPTLTKLKATNEDAQALTDAYIEVRSKEAEATAKTWADKRAKWIADAKADEAIGGDNWENTLQNVDAVRKSEFHTEGFGELVDATGVGDHPEVIRMVNGFGKTLKANEALVKENAELKAKLTGEDIPHKSSGEPAKSAPATAEDNFYDDRTPKAKVR